jgi:squalene-associated FAD-dependent desaturase
MWDVIVIGGGLGGLSAALQLCSRGRRVLLLERRRFLGGRTYSFLDETTGDVLDNGQHLMLGCYAATRRYLERIGSSRLARLQPKLDLRFLHADGQEAALTGGSLPAPAHVLSGLLKLRTLPRDQRISLFRVGWDLLVRSASGQKELDDLSAAEWLERLGQGAQARTYLWDIIAVGALNEAPSAVSALLFFRVLRSAFFGSRENAAFLIPTAGLSELFVDPAETYLRAHGGEIHLGTAAERIVVEHQRAVAVETADGRQLKGRTVVCAVPFPAADGLLPVEVLGEDVLQEMRRRFTWSPIITLNLWFDREVIHHDVAAVLEGSVHWIFNRSAILKAPARARQGQYLSLVVSGAAEIIDRTAEELTETALKDLRRLLPAARDARLLHSRVLKERRATFVPAPGMERVRPAAVTRVANVALAGDWTATGLPATIEGAILSGERAARVLERELENDSPRDSRRDRRGDGP